MSDVFGNHIVGFPTRRLNFTRFAFFICIVGTNEFIIAVFNERVGGLVAAFVRNMYGGL